MSGTLTVLTAGHSVVTDLGRIHGPRSGLPVNGALDQYAATAANVLVGNQPDAPLLEVTGLDAAWRADTGMLVAVTGADADLTVDGGPAPAWAPFWVPAGSSLAVTSIRSGLRVYVAVYGSFAVRELLGSCAPDSIIGFNPPLRPGSHVPLCLAPRPPWQPALGVALFRLGAERQVYADEPIVEVVDGPDIDAFDGRAQEIFGAAYRVGPQSNHVGLRLAGPVPVRREHHEILSRGVPVGAVEAPRGDELLVLHRGRGVTAGYPVLGVVTPDSLDTLAQVRPGQLLRFRHTTNQQAISRLRTRHGALQHLQHRAQQAFAALHLLEQAEGDPRWVTPATPSDPAPVLISR